MKKLFEKLDNPFLLAAEGFIAGAILFVAVNANSLEARIQPARRAGRGRLPALTA